MLVLSLLIPIVLAAGPTAKPAPPIESLQAENARLRKELAACKGPAKKASDPARDEAIASLRAVKSALDGGANLEMFRKYQVESRVKLDQLGRSPEHAPLFEVSDVYADALTFAMIGISGRIDDDTLKRAKEKYSTDVELQKLLDKMITGQFAEGVVRATNQVCGKHASQFMMLIAEERMKTPPFSR